MIRITTLLLLAIGFFSVSNAQSTFIDFQDDILRYPINLESALTTFEICGLEEGTSYRLILSDQSAEECFLHFQKGKGDKIARPIQIEKQTSSTCLTIDVRTSCQSLIQNAYLSIHRMANAQKNKQDNNRMMGMAAVNNSNAFNLIQDVFIGGDCFDISAVTKKGNNGQLGTFSSGMSSIDIDEGVIISTGDVTNANGTNNSSSTSTGYNGNGNDADLTALGGGAQLFDVAGIEFDFTPTVPQISFEYVFASEEYCEFAGSQFNDVFGFFISGPGINGTFANNAENIAVIPGSGAYVGINTVNHTTNTAFYNNNNPPGQNDGCSPTPPVAPNDMEFDGFTEVFTAVANVIPCETYHIKLVIADRGDDIYDSAVFLKANSFSAGATSAVSVDVDQGPTAITAYEGCSNGYFIFERVGDDLSQPFPITFTISPLSTATSGADYASFPTTIVIPAGQTSITLPVTVFADFEFEGTEQIIIELQDACSCQSNVAILEITEPPPLDLFLPDIFACEGEEVTLSPDVFGGVPGYTYQWSTGATTPTITITPDAAVTPITVTVFDDCNQQMTTFLNVFANSPIATLSGEDVICQGDFDAFLEVEFEGFGPFDITYEVDGFVETISGIFGSPFQLPVSIPGTYTLLSVTSAEGCPGEANGTGEIMIAEVLIDADTTNVTCFGLNDGTIDVNPSGGTAPYSFNWNQGLPDEEVVDSLSPGTYIVTVTDDNGCTSNTSYIIEDAEELLLTIDAVEDIDCTNPGNGSISALSSGGTGALDYLWSTGDTLSIVDSLEAGTYFVTVTDSVGCQVLDSAMVVDFIAIPSVDAIATDTLDCATDELTIDGSNSSTGDDFSYQWTTDDGTILSGDQTLNPIVSEPGTYNLVIIDSSNNCVDSTSVEIIQDIVDPTADAGLEDTLNCAITSIELDGSASSSGDDFSYSWTTTDGNIVNGANTIDPEIDEPGTYQLVVTNTQNSCETSATVIIGEDILAPDLSINPTEIVNCYQAEIGVLGIGNGSDAGLTYSWSTTDGNIISGSNQDSIVVNSGGTYELTIQDLGNGCTTTASITVDENSTVPTADAGVDVELSCITATANLLGENSSMNGPYLYTWTTSDGQILADTATLNSVAGLPGFYALTVLDTINGCSSSDVVEVLENSNSPLIAAQVDDILTCDVLAVTLDGTGSSAGNDFTASWTNPNGNTIQNADALQAQVADPGEYTLTVTNQVNGCISSITVEVDQDIVYPFAEAGQGTTLTCTDPEFMLNGTASDQGNPYTFNWSTFNGNITGGADSLNPETNQAGTYYLAITNTENGCVTTDSVEILADQVIPVVNAGDDLTLNCANPSLIIQAQNSDSGSNFQIEWNTLSGTDTLMNSLNPNIASAGQFELVITNTDNGCVNSDVVAVIEDFVPPVADGGSNYLLTCATTDLNLDGSSSSQNGSFSYSWTTTDGNILNGADGLSPNINQPGIYQLIVQNLDNFCLDTTTVTVAQDIVAPIAAAGQPFTLTCTTPEANIDAGGSSIGSDFSYSWNTTAGNIVSGADGLSPNVNQAGVYTLTVLNTFNGCSTTDDVTILVDQEFPMIDAGPDLELNCGFPSLAVQGQNSSSGADFQLTWNTLTGNQQLDNTSLSPTVNEAGIYQLSILNVVNGCLSLDTMEVVENFIAPIADAGSDYILNCVDTIISLDGGSSSIGNEFSYAWSSNDGNILNGSTELSPNIDQPGMYQLIVQNTANFCLDTAMVEVVQDIEDPFAEAGNPFTLTCIMPEGNLDAQLSSQGPQFSYEWQTAEGNILQGDNGLQPAIDQGGNYILTVTNNINGCTSSDIVNIPVDQNYPIVDAGPDGLLDCATTEYTLQIGNSDTGNDFALVWNTLEGNQQITAANVAPAITQPGIYELVITNTTNSCISIDTVLVEQDIVAPLADAGVTDILNCSITSLTLNGEASSQNGPYSYQWSTANGNILSGMSGLSPLIDEPGDYQLIVTNTQNFCTDTSFVNITQDIEAPIANAGDPLVLTCGAPVQSLNGVASSTGDLFVYQWTTTGGNILSGVDGLVPSVDDDGIYQLLVTNTENGCTATDQVVVDVDQELPIVDAGPDQILNCEVNEVDLIGDNSSTGGAFIYNWIFNGAGGIDTQVNTTVDQPGSYTLEITNINNQCVDSDIVEVVIDTITPLAEAGVTATLTCDITTIMLNGEGSSEGNEFTYTWTSTSGNVIDNATTLTPSIENDGFYVLQVLNNINGCTNEDVVEILIDTLSPQVAIADPDILTCAVESIEINSTASGNHSLNFEWTTTNGMIDNGANTLNPVVSDAGLYQLLVTNEGNGCTTFASTEVPIDTVAPIADAGVDALLSCTITNLELDGTGSSLEGMSYEWTTVEGAIQSGSFGLSPNITEAGVYTLQVTDDFNGCQSIDEVLIEIDTLAPLVVISDPDILDCVTPNVTLTGTSDATTVPFEFTWRNAQGTIIGSDNPETIEVQLPGIYTLTVLNPDNGCENQDETEVMQDIEAPIAEAGPSLVLTCVNPEDALDGSSSSVGNNFTYNWMTTNGQILNGASTLTPFIGQAGTYFLTVINETNGCVSSDQVSVTENIPEEAEISFEFPPCFGDDGQIIVETVNGGFGPYSYSIDGGNVFYADNFFPSIDPGVYDVVVQDINGCQIEEQITINAPLELDVQVEAQVTLLLGDDHQVFTFVNFPEEEIASVQWFPSEGLSCDTCLNPIVSPDFTTNYTVVVTTLNGCVDEADIRVIVDRRVNVYIPNAFSPHNNDGTNDRFMIFARDGSVSKINSLMVFNRWGESVYEAYNFPPNDPAYGWDGTFRGVKMNAAVFAYWTEVELIDGSTVILKGDVNLID